MLNKLNLLLATKNDHKVIEISDILNDSHCVAPPIVLHSLHEFSEVPMAEETGATYAENALIKARHYHKLTGMPCIADDSGLEVDALHGEPGLYSSRYGGSATPHSEKIALLLSKLKDVPLPERTARFRCAAVLYGLTPHPLSVESKVEGLITLAPTGSGGFGYDPIFFVPPFQCTMASLSKEDKDTISHRGQAMRLLYKRMQEEIR